VLAALSLPRKITFPGVWNFKRPWPFNHGFNLDTWAGLVAPAGTPPQIVTKLNGALRKIIDSPETQAQFKNIGFEGFSSTPEELGDFIKAQLALWGKMIKDANIQLDWCSRNSSLLPNSDPLCHGRTVDVRFGSEADTTLWIRDGFTPESRHSSARIGCLLCQKQTVWLASPYHSDPPVEKNFNHSNECQFFRFNVREDFL
jgi:hypothetical protein